MHVGLIFQLLGEWSIPLVSWIRNYMLFISQIAWPLSYQVLGPMVMQSTIHWCSVNKNITILGKLILSIACHTWHTTEHSLMHLYWVSSNKIDKYYLVHVVISKYTIARSCLGSPIITTLILSLARPTFSGTYKHPVGKGFCLSSIAHLCRRMEWLRSSSR